MPNNHDSNLRFIKLKPEGASINQTHYEKKT